MRHHQGDRPSPTGAGRLGGVTLEQSALGPGVESGGGLVEDHQDRRSSHQASGERHLLPLPLREVGTAGELPAELGLAAVR